MAGRYYERSVMSCGLQKYTDQGTAILEDEAPEKQDQESRIVTWAFKGEQRNVGPRGQQRESLARLPLHQGQPYLIYAVLLMTLD